MKIIAPTDFSDLSKSALIYAAQLAASTNNPLVLVYNAVFEGPPRATVLINLEEKIELNAIEDMKMLAEWLKKSVEPSPDIFIEITKNHNAAEAILKRTKDIDGGLIILSTRGASGLSGSILGSVSSEVLRKSSIPVMALPPEMESKKEGGFLFAIDPANGLHENLT
ncbi:MAG: universal stress protein [Bacteroidetes bacterium]|nr:universal stress protein [Bacteroidota bacterium]